MKRLFAVTILAVLPVACGTTLPSTPDVAENTTVDNASVSSLANRPAPGPRPTPAPLPAEGCAASDTDVPLDGIQVSILSEGARSVTLRADAVILNSDRPAPCFVPAWSVGSFGRGVTLTVDKEDPQVATLTAPSGRYVVQAALNRLVGQATVTFR